MYVMDYLIYHLRPYGISNYGETPDTMTIPVTTAPLPTAAPALVNSTPVLVPSSNSSQTPRLLRAATLKARIPVVPDTPVVINHLAEDPTKASDWLAPDDRRS